MNVTNTFSDRQQTYTDEISLWIATAEEEPDDEDDEE